MKLFNNKQYRQLIENGRKNIISTKVFPVVKWDETRGDQSWIVSHILPNNMFFCIYDDGWGSAEYETIHIDLLETYIAGKGNRIERDKSFVGLFPMSVYRYASSNLGEITLNETYLERAARKLRIKKRIHFEKPDRFYA